MSFNDNLANVHNSIFLPRVPYSRSFLELDLFVVAMPRVFVC